MAQGVPPIAQPAKPGPTGDRGIGNAPKTMTTGQVSAWQYLQRILGSYGFKGNDLNALVAELEAAEKRAGT